MAIEVNVMIVSGGDGVMVVSLGVLLAHSIHLI